MAESTRCLQCTCEAIGFCDLRRLGIEYGTTLATLEPQFHQGAGYRSVTENRFTGINHDYVRDDSHAFILREPSRCIDCGRCANVCAEVVGAACYDFMRIGFDTLVTTPLDMSLNDTPCVSCGRCAETCPTSQEIRSRSFTGQRHGRRRRESSSAPAITLMILFSTGSLEIVPTITSRKWDQASMKGSRYSGREKKSSPDSILADTSSAWLTSSGESRCCGTTIR